MIELTHILQRCDTLLSPHNFQDYCPNGLQIAGTQKIRHIVSGVTACQALIDRAITLNADIVLVHHGFFWKNEAPQIIGTKQQRIKALLTHDINLIAYHLPLDAHPEFGNNAQLAKKLGITVKGTFGQHDLALWGTIPESSAPAFASQLTQTLGRTPQHFGPNHAIRNIGLCTGAAQSFLGAAAELGLDAFISGEVSESTYHLAVETPIHYFSAGHHATERYGVQALGNHLADHFQIGHTFVDIDNPV